MRQMKTGKQTRERSQLQRSSRSSSRYLLRSKTAQTHSLLRSEVFIQPWRVGCATPSRFRPLKLVSGREKRRCCNSCRLSLPNVPIPSLSVAVHYLPKFYLHPEALLWPSISLMDHKRFGPDCNKWKTYHARLTDSAPTYPAGREPELRISVPRTEQAVSSHCFQVIVYLRVPGASQSELNDYVSKTTVQGLKVMTMMANGSKSAQYVAIGRSYIQQIEKELVEPDARIIRAGTRGGAHEGEATWNVGQLINVEVCHSHSLEPSISLTPQYFVRVSVKPEEHKAPIFQHDVRVHMFTHTRDQYDSPFEAHDAPAYNLLLGCSLSNNLPTIHGA